MVRVFCIVLLIPILAQSQKFTATDLQRLREWSAGSFSNAAQLKAGIDLQAATIRLQPIWLKRKDGAWIFTQLQDTSMNFAVWHYYIQDDTTLVLQFFDFKDREKAVQLSRDIKNQSFLKIFNLITRRGCEVYLKWDKHEYAGNSVGKDCFSDNKKIEYYSYKVSLSKNRIDWWEGAFGKEDKTLFSTPGNGFHFARPIKSSK
jgi:hypothetical protein